MAAQAEAVGSKHGQAVGGIMIQPVAAHGDRVNPGIAGAGQQENDLVGPRLQVVEKAGIAGISPHKAQVFALKQQGVERGFDVKGRGRLQLQPPSSGKSGAGVDECSFKPPLCFFGLLMQAVYKICVQGNIFERLHRKAGQPPGVALAWIDAAHLQQPGGEVVFHKRLVHEAVFISLRHAHHHAVGHHRTGEALVGPDVGRWGRP